MYHLGNTATVTNGEFILKQEYVWLLKTIRNGGNNNILENKIIAT